MYKRKNMKIWALTILLCVCIGMMISIKPVSAAITFDVKKEWAHIEILQNGDLTLFYELELKITGEPQRGIYLGMPNKDIKEASAEDGQGHTLICEIETSPWERLMISWDEAVGELSAGQTIVVKATAKIGSMIFDDSSINPGNVGMQFIPCWWDGHSEITNFRIEIVLPEGVNENNLKNVPDYDNLLPVDGKWKIYWERDMKASEVKNFKVGVSFPNEFLLTDG